MSAGGRAVPATRGAHVLGPLSWMKLCDYSKSVWMDGNIPPSQQYSVEHCDLDKLDNYEGLSMQLVYVVFAYQ